MLASGRAMRLRKHVRPIPPSASQRIGFADVRPAAARRCPRHGPSLQPSSSNQRYLSSSISAPSHKQRVPIYPLSSPPPTEKRKLMITELTPSEDPTPPRPTTGRAAMPTAEELLFSQTSKLDPLCNELVASKPILEILTGRGHVQDTSSHSIIRHLEEASRSIYLGIDPTAPALHVGHLFPLLTLVWLLRAGHRGVLLIGGATAAIGDPSGKTESRPEMSAATLNGNIDAIDSDLRTIMNRISRHLGSGGIMSDVRKESASRPVARGDRGEPLRVRILNNAKFSQGTTMMEFLTEFGKYARMTDMLSRDSVRTRMPEPWGDLPQGKSGISFTEFTYQLLQAYDFYKLYNDDSAGNCTVQLGGSDQRGNIMAGVDLIRKRNLIEFAQKVKDVPLEDIEFPGDDDHADPAFGLMTPLLTTENGEKLGKSAGNAIPLTQGSDYDFYQYFMRLPDADTVLLLRAITFLSDGEIQQRVETHWRRHRTAERPGHPFTADADPPNIWFGMLRRVLADEVTAMVRGPEALSKAQWMSTFLHKALPSSAPTKQMQRDLVDNASRKQVDALWEKLRAAADEQSFEVMTAAAPPEGEQASSHQARTAWLTKGREDDTLATPPVLFWPRDTPAIAEYTRRTFEDDVPLSTPVGHFARNVFAASRLCKSISEARKSLKAPTSSLKINGQTAAELAKDRELPVDVDASVGANLKISNEDVVWLDPVKPNGKQKKDRGGGGGGGGGKRRGFMFLQYGKRARKIIIFEQEPADLQRNSVVDAEG